MILLILKIIGILLLALACLLLLLLLLVLFVPIRSFILVEVPRDDLRKSCLEARISWLLKAVRFTAAFRNGKLTFRFSALWLRILDSESEVDEYLGRSENPDRSENPRRSETPEADSDNTDKPELKYSENEQGLAPAAEKLDEDLEEIARTLEKDASRETSRKKTEEDSGTHEEHSRSRILLAYLKSEKNREALKQAAADVRRFLRASRFRVTSGQFTVGREDPAETGKIFAMLSLFYPFFGNHFEVRPCFTENLFFGTAIVRGRMFLFSLAKMLLRLFMNKRFLNLISLLRGERVEDGQK